MAERVVDWIFDRIADIAFMAIISICVVVSVFVSAWDWLVRTSPLEEDNESC